MAESWETIGRGFGLLPPADLDLPPKPEDPPAVGLSLVETLEAARNQTLTGLRVMRHGHMQVAHGLAMVEGAATHVGMADLPSLLRDLAANMASGPAQAPEQPSGTEPAAKGNGATATESRSTALEFWTVAECPAPLMCTLTVIFICVYVLISIYI